MKKQTKNQLLETVAAMDETQIKRLSRAKVAEIEKWIKDNAEQPLSPDEAENQNMSQTIAKYRASYVPSISASERKSLNCGDKIAAMLAGMSAHSVMVTAERLLDMEEGELVTKYNNLNQGQKRMNAGNRIRAAIKRGDKTIEDLEGVLAI